MIALNKLLKGGKKKRLMGIATTQEGKEAFNNYYETQRSYLGKVFDMQYQKDNKHTLTPCDAPEFVKCRKDKPNKDGKGNTCLDVAERVCPKKSRGSAKYTGTKKGPQRFDMIGVDTFKEGEEIDVSDITNIKDKTVISFGLPKSTKKMPGKLNRDIAKEQYAKRKKDGLPDIVTLKKKRESCKGYRKNIKPRCEDMKNCSWVHKDGCRRRKTNKEIKQEKKDIQEELLEISDDSDDETSSLEDTASRSAVAEFRNIDDLQGIKNINKIKLNKDEIICMNYIEGVIRVFVYDEKEDTIRSEASGKLVFLIDDVVDKFRNIKELVDFDEWLEINPDLCEFVPDSQTGGSLSINLYIDTSNGKVSYDSHIIGQFSNGSIKLF